MKNILNNAPVVPPGTAWNSRLGCLEPANSPEVDRPFKRRAEQVACAIGWPMIAVPFIESVFAMEDRIAKLEERTRWLEAHVLMPGARESAAFGPARTR